MKKFEDYLNENYVKSARDLGYDAYYDGQDRESNPYDHDSLEYGEWTSGWLMAQKHNMGPPY